MIIFPQDCNDDDIHDVIKIKINRNIKEEIVSPHPAPKKRKLALRKMSKNWEDRNERRKRNQLKNERKHRTGMKEEKQMKKWE